MSVSDLPAFNAGLNSLATLLLLAGFLFIKNERKIAHRFCMLGAFFVDTDDWKTAILRQGREALARASAAIRAG